MNQKLEERELEFEKKFFKNGKVRIFVDASFHEEKNIGHIGIVVYSNQERITTHLIKDIPARSSNYLEIQAVTIGFQLYKHARIHTDSCHAISRIQKKRILERLYLIKGKYNPADSLIRTGETPEKLDLTELVTHWCVSK